MSPNHLHVQSLNISLAKQLTLQLIKSVPFRQIMACAARQWQVLIHHVICDNSTNLLATFLQQPFTHVRYLAHAEPRGVALPG